MKIRLVLLAMVVLAVCTYAAFKLLPLDAFQKDADIMRLRHLLYYGEIIEEYRSVAGHYPLEGKSDLPTYVFVANSEQISYVVPPNVPHKMISFREFVKDVERVLGRHIDELYDPQFRPVNKPNFYAYLIVGTTYQFGVSVHQPMTFAREISENHYRITLSNQMNVSQKTMTLDELKNSAGFQQELNKKISRDGLFKVREAEFKNYTDTLSPSE